MAQKECKPEVKSFSTLSTSIIAPDEVAKRYKHSNYLIDPNFRSFSSIVRILVIVRQFIKKYLKITSLRPKQLEKLNQEIDTKEVEKYLFRKATSEVKAFLPSTKFKKISKMKDDILYYTGRILPTDEATIVGNATNVMKDLSVLHFLVPIVDRHSPLAYSIVNQIHWNHQTAKHSGNNMAIRASNRLHHRRQILGEANQISMHKMSLPDEKTTWRVNGTSISRQFQHRSSIFLLSNQPCWTISVIFKPSQANNGQDLADRFLLLNNNCCEDQGHGGLLHHVLHAGIHSACMWSRLPKEIARWWKQSTHQRLRINETWFQRSEEQNQPEVINWIQHLSSWWT